jgi:hypothetical protein
MGACPDHIDKFWLRRSQVRAKVINRKHRCHPASEWGETGAMTGKAPENYS